MVQYNIVGGLSDKIKEKGPAHCGELCKKSSFNSTFRSKDLHQVDLYRTKKAPNICRLVGLHPHSVGQWTACLLATQITYT